MTPIRRKCLLERKLYLSLGVRRLQMTVHFKRWLESLPVGKYTYHDYVMSEFHWLKQPKRIHEAR